MRAYHSDPTIKTAILAQLAAHAAADELIKGQYWEDGKGCAVGCTIHSDDHAEYESRFGIPQMLARLEDCVFEGLPNKDAKAWPTRFMIAIEPGIDLSRVGWRFLHWLLTDQAVSPGITHPIVADAVADCARLMADLADGRPVEASAASAAASAARNAASAASAAESAESAASAARNAESAAWSAASAAASAAWSAASAARNAESAAWSAASAARNAESAAWIAAESAESAAWSAASAAAYQKMADKLVDLIQAEVR